MKVKGLKGEPVSLEYIGWGNYYEDNGVVFQVSGMSSNEFLTPVVNAETGGREDVFCGRKVYRVSVELTARYV